MAPELDRLLLRPSTNKHKFDSGGQLVFGRQQICCGNACAATCKSPSKRVRLSYLIGCQRAAHDWPSRCDGLNKIVLKPPDAVRKRQEGGFSLRWPKIERPDCRASRTRMSLAVLRAHYIAHTAEPPCLFGHKSCSSTRLQSSNHANQNKLWVLISWAQLVFS